MDCKRCVLLFLLLGLLLPAASCLADGKVFATEAVQTSIPRQQALLCYRNGVETLAIQTQFVGKGKEFAWVVPLPSTPEVTPATTGLFPTIDVLLTRELRASPHFVSLWVLFVASIILMLVMQGPVRFAALILFILIFMLLTTLFSSLGTPNSGAVAVGSILLDRQLVGSYDVAVLTGDDAAHLAQWLTDHGFRIPREVAPALEHYINKQWCFVAARLRTDATTNKPMTPHPLIFRFKTQKAVYPMYLTTQANSQPLRLDLYVLGDNQATATGFQTIQTRHAIYDSMRIWHDPDYYPRSTTSAELPVGHPTLLQIADHAPYLTHLRTIIKPDKLTDDIELEWKPFHPYQPAIYTYAARWAIAIDSALALLISGRLLVYLLKRGGKITPRTATRAYVLVVVSALLLCGAIRFCLSATQSGPRPRYLLYGRDAQTENIVNNVIQPAIASARDFYPLAEIDYEWLHYLLFTKGGALMVPDNGFHLPLHEQDSPGSFLLRQTDQGFELVGFDLQGIPDVVAFNVPLTPTTRPAE